MGFSLGSLLSPIQSAFTPPGTHAATGRDNNNSGAQSFWSQQLKNGYSPLISSQLGFANSLEPGRQSALMQGISSQGQSGVDASVRDFGNGANERAANSANSASLMMRGNGYNPGAGQIQGAFNNAQAQTNQFAQQVNSPEAKAQRYQRVLELYNSGMSPNDIMAALQVTQGGIYGQPTPYVGKGIGDYAGAALGAWAGGGFKKK